MSFITKRRLASLASASAIIATMAVAAAPAATMAADVRHRPGSSATATTSPPHQIGGAVTGTIDATGFDIGVYNPTSVTETPTSTARSTTASSSTACERQRDQQQGPPHRRTIPFDGTQHGRAIIYINGASGTISGNKVYDFQKNGIEVIGLTADGSDPSSAKTSATVQKNVVTGEGPIAYIAQNGIVIRNGASATVKNNTVSGFDYTPDGHRGHGRAALSTAGPSRHRPTSSPTTR